MENNTLSWRPSWRHVALEKEIRELDSKNMSRSEITNRAVVEAATVNDWKILEEELSLLETEEMSIPSSMQATLDEETLLMLPGIREKMLIDLKDNIKRLMVPYFMLLLWINYRNVLRQKVIQIGERKEKIDITGPQLVERLVQILLLNREKDQETLNRLKSILIEWKE